MRRALLAALLLAASPLSAAPRLARVVVLETRVDTTDARAVEVTIDVDGKVVKGPTRTLGDRRLVHAPDGVVRGALDARGELLIAAEQPGGADRSFSGALFSLSRAAPLLDHLAYASRPLIVGRRAYLQLGHTGQERSDGRMRDDELSLVELDLDTNRSRTVATLTGQLLYPVGVDAERRLIAYAVGPKGTLGEDGRLVAFDSAGHAHDLGAIGTARDFSLVTKVRTPEGGFGPAVIYERRDGGHRVVYAHGLDGRRIVIARGGSTPMAPVPLPDGTVHMSEPGSKGKIDILRAIDARSGLGLWQRYLPGRPEPLTLVRRLDGSGELVLPVAAGARLEPVGFVESR